MKIVNKNIIICLACQKVAEVICKQTAAGRIRRALIFLKKVKTCKPKGILHAFPENRKVIGINADADHNPMILFHPLIQIPVYSRGLPIAHRSYHRCQGTPGDRPQLLLQTL